MSLSEEEIAGLKQSFKRCSPETLEAILRYRVEGDRAAVNDIIYGIIERYLPPETEKNIRSFSADARLAEDLGIDSLTMLEVVMSIEEAMGLRIENSELTAIATLGDVLAFLELKLDGGVAAGKPSVETLKFSRDQIMLALPQATPFLFVDEAKIEGDTVTATYTPDAGEFFFQGHFKDEPVLPATIAFEAVGQAACLWILEVGLKREKIKMADHHKVYFTSMGEAHFHRKVVPGETLTLEAHLARLRSPLAVFDCKITLKGERVAEVFGLTLAFGDKEEAAASAEQEPETAPALEEKAAT